MASLTVRPACPEDAALLLELFGGLAEYEHLEHELQATEAQLREALFGERPAAEALIAERPAATATPRPSRRRSATPCSFRRSRASSRARACGWRICSCARSTAARASAGRCSRRSRRASCSAAASAGMGRARLERAGARLLPEDRRADDGGVGHPPPRRRGARARRGAGTPVAFSTDPLRTAGSRPRSPMDKTTAS